jgi:hypothetical protein
MPAAQVPVLKLLPLVSGTAPRIAEMGGRVQPCGIQMHNKTASGNKAEHRGRSSESFKTCPWRRQRKASTRSG